MKKLTYSLVSSVITEYKDLLLLAAVTFCALCIIHFFSTMIFHPGEWGSLFYTGETTFGVHGR